jgi:4-diphosphocytidyl-2-C-methyl-D-erythritol kinase
MLSLYDVPAPAKLNLFLAHHRARPDGYHLLQSVFMLIDWCDTLHFRTAPGTASITREDLGPTLPPDDLTLRAAHALQAGHRLFPGRAHRRAQKGSGPGGHGRRLVRRGHHAAGTQPPVEAEPAAPQLQAIG